MGEGGCSGLNSSELLWYFLRDPDLHMRVCREFLRMNRLGRSDWVGSEQLLTFLRALIPYNFIQRYTHKHRPYKFY